MTYSSGNEKITINISQLLLCELAISAGHPKQGWYVEVFPYHCTDVLHIVW